ncbi:hypothetical protein HPB47_009068 [Ixodes persulcatus]|uniref:Uncharacterized protein n=1 Tax=Ixodes persulcatus TaxID=34615 RepID=A0AC60P2X3_IXOPE|nr:hypothetical protein HPB47_009068 [Ixodes persulcatus]
MNATVTSSGIIQYCAMVTDSASKAFRSADSTTLSARLPVVLSGALVLTCCAKRGCLTKDDLPMLWWFWVQLVYVWPGNCESRDKHSRINTLEDRAETYRNAQVQRLERTRPGRAILQLLGYQLMGRPTISPPPPPWEDEAVVDHRPMKQNVDKDQKGRRNNAAKKHAESIQDARPGSETVHVYTDAAVKEDAGGTAIAWFCLNTESKANFAFHKKHSTKEAELRAIIFAVEDESLTPEGSKHLRVYTDSKGALATYRSETPPAER